MERQRKDQKLKEKDLLFIKAVDFILKLNRRYKIKPDSERGLSLIISTDPSTIAKIRRGSRSITIDQIQAFGNYYGLDFNYFFRNQLQVRHALFSELEGRYKKLKMNDRLN